MKSSPRRDMRLAARSRRRSARTLFGFPLFRNLSEAPSRATRASARAPFATVARTWKRRTGPATRGTDGRYRESRHPPNRLSVPMIFPVAVRPSDVPAPDFVAEAWRPFLRAYGQPRLRDRNLAHRPASASADRRLRTHARTVAAPVSAGRRRRRGQDDHDRALCARDVVAASHPAGSRRSACRPRRQLAVRDAGPAPAAVPHRLGRRRPRRQPLRRAGKRSDHRRHRHPRRRAHVRAVAGRRDRTLRPHRLRRSPQTVRRPRPGLPGAQDRALPAGADDSRRTLLRSARHLLLLTATGNSHFGLERCGGSVAPRKACPPP